MGDFSARLVAPALVLLLFGRLAAGQADLTPALGPGAHSSRAARVLAGAYVAWEQRCSRPATKVQALAALALTSWVQHASHQSSKLYNSCSGSDCHTHSRCDVPCPLISSNSNAGCIHPPAAHSPPCCSLPTLLLTHRPAAHSPPCCSLHPAAHSPPCCSLTNPLPCAVCPQPLPRR